MLRSSLTKFSWIFFLLLWGVTWPCCTPPDNPGNDGGDQDQSVKEKAECKYNSDCKNCDAKCQEGKCVKISCQSDDDCRCQWKCIKKVCYDPAKAPCQEDSDCTDDPKLWKCQEGKCIDGGCQKDADCKEDPKKPICDVKNHTCIKRSCVSDSDCLSTPGKPICDKKSGDCIADPGVEEGQDCSSKPCLRSLTCHEKDGKKRCRVSCEPFGSWSECKPGLVCVRQPGPTLTGLCLEPGKGLKEGEDCAGDKLCQLHLRCIFAAGEERCRRSCLKDDVCQSKEKCVLYQKEKACLPEPEPCGPGRSCPGEQEGWHQCINGQCKLLLCPDEYNCPPTHKCQSNGRCIPRECPKDPCADLYECRNGRCVETNEGKLCGQGKPIEPDKCGAGLICTRVGYIQTCVRPCEVANCPSDLSCQKNMDGKKICIQNCPAGKPCKYKGHVCFQIKRPPGNYCVPPGQPVGGDLLEYCDPQNKCLPGLRCFTYYSSNNKGYCIKNCTTQADCDGNTNAVCLDYYSTGQCCYKKCNSSTDCTISSTHGNVAGYCQTDYKTRKKFCRPR